MPKFPRLKVTTISKGRVYQSVMSRPIRPHDHPETLDISNGRVYQRVMSRPRDQSETLEKPPAEKEPASHKIQEKEAWEKVKKDLRTSFDDSICPQEGLDCIICQKKPDHLVTCSECSRTGQVFCRNCAIQMHKQHCLLHSLVEWQVGGNTLSLK